MAVNFKKLADFDPNSSIKDVCLSLEERINRLESVIGWDEELRRQNPALQDLYEKYQSTKKLVTK